MGIQTGRGDLLTSMTTVALFSVISSGVWLTFYIGRINIGQGAYHDSRRTACFSHMSVKDNLLMGAFTRRDKVGIAHDLASVMEKFPRLKERYRQSAATMSGGEQQMLVIGRALMAWPKLLLLDEPSLGMADLAARLSETHAIPVIDGVVCALKLCEALLAANLKTSKIRGYTWPRDK